MGYFLRLRLVIMPQAVKIMIPPMIGLFTLLLKGTAIGFIIEYRELIRVGQITIERLVMSGHQHGQHRDLFRNHDRLLLDVLPPEPYFDVLRTQTRLWAKPEAL